MAAYKCIFFDLDHTLWDYEANSEETLRELFERYALNNTGVACFENFHTKFKEINLDLWDQYDRGMITSDTIRKERFKRLLNHFDAFNESLATDLSAAYLSICPSKGKLMPHALDTVAYLHKKYDLTIITNGFEEIQHIKLVAGNLSRYFNHMITSQKAGCKKPAPQIFEYALKSNGIRCHEALMVGDNLLNDVAGAQNAYIDAVFFNPDKIVHNEEVRYEISNLNELRELL